MKQQYKHLILLIALGVILATMFWSSWNPSFDDALYVKYAGQALAGNFTILQSAYAYGFIYIYSLAGAQALLGTTGLPLLQVLEYIAITIMVYWIRSKILQPKNSLCYFTVS